MKKVLVMVALVMVSVIVYAFNDKEEANQGKKEVTGNGEVVVMNKEMFLKDVFDYEKSKEWKYTGDKPAIIDLYADWCGPCRQTAPIMKELAKEYAGKITIYKVNVDKYGLDNTDRSLLLALIETFHGGPVGLDTLAACIGEDSGTIEDVYEPFLIQNGFLARTPRGRIVTEKTYHHLGLSFDE